MNNTEQEMINGLFDRLKNADNKTAPRDEMAEKLIKEHIEKHPEAVYYMVQVILIQEEAIKKLNEQISNLEKDAAASKDKDKGKGFLSKLFGINEVFDRQRSSSNSQQIPVGSYGKIQKNTSIPSSTPISSSQNISFLNSALRTALGVAGGVMIGDVLKSFVHPSLSQEGINIPTHHHHTSDDNTILINHISPTHHDNTDDDISSSSILQEEMSLSDIDYNQDSDIDYNQDDNNDSLLYDQDDSNYDNNE
ncbi:DUF2076 domain-containing protein [Candidatus Ishikawella capsulata]|uniref:DUF2076 domain-containing protein n=1 Tax=Candidatus Ishikawaella capsulata Mpkobe TaxID=476281 RepID=C5WDA6_9ENTR|nr:DUF2076 domain-containing protein [Candidatus Ishikawaella capsulata]BAH83312.1 hypothetical protein ICMP_461 [Candidatus Ishikawaella capsulata Mpkobe]